VLDSLDIANSPLKPLRDSSQPQADIQGVWEMSDIGWDIDDATQRISYVTNRLCPFVGIIEATPVSETFYIIGRSNRVRGEEGTR
jgi:hypothetical protein